MVESVENRQLVDVQEMARILQVPVSWIYRKTRFNEIPCVRVGKYVRFDPEKVLAYLHGMQTSRKK